MLLSRSRRSLVVFVCTGACALAAAAPGWAAGGESSILGSAQPANPSDSDTSSTELGVVFHASQAGQITGLRFYKGAGNNGTHTGALWTSSGTRLAQLTFSGETASGWQTARFATPVAINAGTDYIASYHAADGHYAGDTNSYAKPLTNGPLTATAGRYAYSPTQTLPTQTYHATNYYVDVLYATTLAAAPTAAFSYTPANPQPGTDVIFNASASSCPATPCSYSWQDVGASGTEDWPLGSGQTIHFTFHNPGTKYVQLTVTDAQNRTASTQHNITLTPTPTPTATPSPSPTATPSPTPTATPSPTPSPSPSPTPSPSPGTCDRTATPATLSSQVSAATSGQSICLASGDYGTFWGTGNNKPLTLRAADGASPKMVFDLGTGDSNLTLEGFSALSGTTDAVPITNLVFRDNAFNDRAWMRSTAANNGIVFDNDTFININPHSGDVAGRLYFDGVNGCGYLVQNSLFQGGGSDGVRVGCRGVQILNNRFLEIQDLADAHPDPIQIYGGSNVVIRGNYFQNTTSEIAGYIQVSGGSDSLTIEDNVFRAGRYTYVANLGLVKNSTFNHNTAEGGTCANNTPCGTLVTDQSSNLSITNNILGRQPNAATVQNNLLYGGSATGTNFTGTPTYIGPADTWSGWKLTTTSTGKARATDGTDVGI
jgi:hypothetical protein